MTTEQNPLRVRARRPFQSRVLERLLGLHNLIPAYDAWQAKGATSTRPVEAFLDHVVSSLGSDMTLEQDKRLADIPAGGPVIFYANHPLGGLEGVLLTRLLLRHRPDLKVLTNDLLTRIPEFQELFIGVDVLSGNATLRNLKGMRHLSRHLKTGGALLIFPAGLVASVGWSPWGSGLFRGVVESPWTTMLGRLARRYGAACMPFFVHGRNSAAFYAAGLIHRRLRTCMLIRQLINKRDRRIRVTCGTILGARQLDGFSSDESLTRHLRRCCEALREG